MMTTVKRLRLLIREAVEFGDDEEKYGGKGPFVLPDDHIAGMKVPKGGSSCANCRFADLREDGPYCLQENWVTWNGGESRLPVDDPETYCSDWFEPKD